MNNFELKVIQPNISNPVFVKKTILYPQYMAQVKVDVPRAILKPRRFIVYLLVDGCTGKVSRSDSWPVVITAQQSEEKIPTRLSTKEAKECLNEYALKKIARRYLTYWEPSITIDKLVKLYKIFWLVDSNSVVDSLSSRKLNIS